jgi:cell division protein FtsA
MAKKYILGVDVGTGSVKVLAGMIGDGGSFVIKGSGAVPTAGFSRGVITNVAELAAAVKAAIDCAVMAADIFPDSIYLGIGGMDISSANNIGSIAPSSPGTITGQDVERACRAAAVVTMSEGQRIMHVLPTGYWVDGEKLVEKPLGRSGARLEVETHIVTVPETNVDEFINALAVKGIHITDVFANAVVAAEVLAATVEEPDYLVMDIGAGITNLALFSGDKIRMSAFVPLGGDYITNDIAQGIGVSQVHAEEIKRYYARLNKRLRGHDVILDCNDYGTTDKQVSYDFLNTIVESRIEEIVAMIHSYLEPALSRYSITRIVLTGGAAMLPSICETLDRVFGVPVSLISPEELPPEYAHPSNVACFGILRYAAGMSTTEPVSGNGSWRLLFKKLKDLTR